jgi:hypothetical protein
MSTEQKQEQEKSKVIVQLGLTEDGLTGLMRLLDVVRKTGTRQEAILALNWMSDIEQSIITQQKAKKEESNDDSDLSETN